MYRFRATLLFVVLALFLTACPGGEGVTGSAPQITSFTANPETITAAGQAVALSWTVTNGVTSLEIDNGVGEVSGTSVVVFPSAATTYTLTASNSSGSTSASIMVNIGTGSGNLVEDGLPPTLNTFGVSPTQSDFQSDQGSNIENASDPRIVRVQPNSTFFAVVSATDPGGIAGVTIRLRNDEPAGFAADLIQGQEVNGFTLNGEVSGCVLDGTQTSVTCIYEIAVGNIPNITALPGSGDEFAYVFRTRVADVSGLESDVPPRGYVIVGESGGTPNPPPGNPPPVEPPPVEPPANRAPTVNITAPSMSPEPATVGIKEELKATSDDSDEDSLTFKWNVVKGTAGNVMFDNDAAEDTGVMFTATGNYVLRLTVNDGKGGIASASVTFNVTGSSVSGGS